MTEIGAGDALSSLQAQRAAIASKVATAVLALLGSNVLAPSPETIASYALRDSISHRLLSVEYHLVLLLRAQLDTQTELEKAPTAFHDDEFLIRSGNRQLFLFDDLIFNICSLWDYIAGFVARVCQHKQEMKWNALVKSSSDHYNPLSASRMSPRIIDLHKRFVNSLFRYRALLYHNRADPSSYSMRWTYTEHDTRVDFKAGIPQGVMRAFGFIKENPEIDSMSLIDVCFLIVQRTFSGIAELIDQCGAKAE